MSRTLALLGASLVLAACSDSVSPRADDDGPGTSARPTTKEMFARFVVLGTSNSMGVQSAGVFAAGQTAAWPAELARRVGVTFSLPLVRDPGCGPPLVAPLAENISRVGTFGDDSSVCAPLRDGVTLPTSSVAISGANVSDALRSTPESETARNARRGELYRRVLPPGKTQVTAMLAQNPTFVAVELAANEVLPASSGRIEAMTPYADWERDFDQVLAAVKSTGARAVLVGLPSDAANFPSVRRARELFAEAAFLRTLRITVGIECDQSPNSLFITGYVLNLIARAPTTATCANVPGAGDYVLTPSDISAINARMAQMNAHIQAKASENGYAYFSIEAVYGLAKPRFSMSDLVFSATPFGPSMSLDGVHPSTAGQAILANAAAQAINAKYGVAIP
jgi:hypothetical protein